MKSSESIKNLVPALLKAQRLMGGAKKGASNPYFKSRYADLGAVLEACKELLNDEGIVILQPHSDGSVETVLVHESGEWISSQTPITVAKVNDPQALGSAITYARRYGLQSLLSMPAEDDDGEGAMARGKQKGAADEEAGTAPAKQSPQASKGSPVAKEAPKAPEHKGSTGGGTPEEPPTDRQELNTMISQLSAVIIAKKIKSLDELKADLVKQYGTSKKEELTDEQASEAYKYLRSIL